MKDFNYENRSDSNIVSECPKCLHQTEGVMGKCPHCDKGLSEKNILNSDLISKIIDYKKMFVVSDEAIAQLDTMSENLIGVLSDALPGYKYELDPSSLILKVESTDLSLDLSILQYSLICEKVTFETLCRVDSWKKDVVKIKEMGVTRLNQTGFSNETNAHLMSFLMVAHFLKNIDKLVNLVVSKIDVAA